ncbi:hypothetical protein Dsin_014640 [Dipteronia sinensis]|uniref:Short-chain dehydrogenase TIC 32, chloroplastic n=1 Tax=Dipteronia sinensis TaxID=43782 RepID=A0AAE0AMW7_9ROSI|nr:hypothetical protein Dsin_014640 [Dipteronia sinensis]
MDVSDIKGASSGIGTETTRVLALRGVHVIMAVRNMAAGKDVKEAIVKEIPSAKVDAMELDLSSMASVRKFASDFNTQGLPLNLLINNAGIMATPFMLSKDKIEMQFATNHIGHFLLTTLLLDTMKKTARESKKEGRIVNVASEAHRFAYGEGIRFDKINDESWYNSLGAYGQSKLANILHANELSKHLKEEGVNITANSLHPGSIVTNLFRHSSIINGLTSTIGRLLLKNVQQVIENQFVYSILLVMHYSYFYASDENYDMMGIISTLVYHYYMNGEDELDCGDFFHLRCFFGEIGNVSSTCSYGVVAVVVVGASSGIGTETARVLALRGVHVVMAVRNMEAGSQVRDAIVKENPSANVHAMELDLSSIASVRKFAADYESSGLPLNLLINNAGIIAPRFMLSKDNIELQFATNHIGHFLLTNLLLETMKKTACESRKEGRIVNVTSGRHKFSYLEGIRFDKINDKMGYNFISAYGQSKLANILHANELAKRLKVRDLFRAFGGILMD